MKKREWFIAMGIIAILIILWMSAYGSELANCNELTCIYKQ